SSAILGIGIWIGKSLNKATESQQHSDLRLIINYIDEQKRQIDSLENLVGSSPIKPIYYKLDDFEEEKNFICSIEEGKSVVSFKTRSFHYLGEGIYEFKLIIKKFIDGKFIFQFSTPTQFYEQKNQYFAKLNFFINPMLKSDEKYEATLVIGNYKKTSGEVLCK
ncbi:MAG: hypothetical protein AAFX87_01860, partial [Bacteroidota bacterium]